MEKTYEIVISDGGDRSVGIPSTNHVLKCDQNFIDMLKDSDDYNNFRKDLEELFTKYHDEFGYTSQDEKEMFSESLWEEYGASGNIEYMKHQIAYLQLSNNKYKDWGIELLNKWIGEIEND